MSTIYKYELPIVDRALVRMPAGAVVLHIDVQRGLPYIWALVDPDAATDDRMFYVRGTGQPMGWAEGQEHLGSFLLEGGAFVFHVFGARGPS